MGGAGIGLAGLRSLRSSELVSQTDMDHVFPR